MKEVLFIVSTALCAFSLVHAVIFTITMRWHGKNVRLVYDDYDRYILRMALPPWYVRYSAWVLRKPLDPPSKWVLNRPVGPPP